MYKLKIERSEYPESPRDWDNLGKMVCWHGRYKLGDEQRQGPLDQWFRELACSLDPSAERKIAYYEDGAGWERIKKAAPTLKDAFEEYDRVISKIVNDVISKNAVMLPLYLFDHGGLSMKVTPFPCPWDSGQVGYIYATREDILREYSAKRLTRKLRSRVEDVLRAEVELYSKYLEGEIYDYIIIRAEEPCDCNPEETCRLCGDCVVVDSCSSFYSYDEAWKEGMKALEFYRSKDHEITNAP